MTMGFKYQMLACKSPQELFAVTMNHLTQLRSKVLEAKPVSDLVDQVILLTTSKYKSMPCADFAGLKQALSRFFSDKKVKVSLFLQDGIQKQDGAIVLSNRGTMPSGVGVPGQITYFDQSGNSASVDSFVFPGAEQLEPAPSNAPWVPVSSQLGLNLYAKDSCTSAASAASAAAVAAATAQAEAQMARPSPTKLDSTAAERGILSDESAQHSTKGLNLLAELIGAGASATATENFKLNLFPDTNIEGVASGNGGNSVPLITIDTGSHALHASNKHLVGIMDDMRIDNSESAGEDDLLGLMDAA